MEHKLLIECAKYLSSEGIYYTKDDSNILACINGQFVGFEFTDKKIPTKMLASGGLVNRPRSLGGFIETVKDLEKFVGGKNGTER